MRHFEDFAAGQTFELGSHPLELDEMLGFARRYDPQVFHVDEEAAKETPYRGLIASGWLTLAIMARLGVDGLMSGVAGLGSPGLDSARWLEPVRAGDTLRGRGRVLRTKTSDSDPRRGTVWFEIELLRDRDAKPVLRVELPMFVARRDAAGGGAAA